MEGRGRDVELDWTLQTSIVEKIHLKVLYEVARRIGGGTMETERAWNKTTDYCVNISSLD